LFDYLVGLFPVIPIPILLAFLIMPNNPPFFPKFFSPLFSIKFSPNPVPFIPISELKIPNYLNLKQQ
jgi:hypothetical protein